MSVLFSIMAFLLAWLIKAAFLGNVSDDDGSEMDEVFPPVDILEPEDVAGLPETADVPVAVGSGDSGLPVPELSETPVSIESDGGIAVPDAQLQDKKNSARKRFHFKNKSEIKRAVLYSEILHNKYDC